MDGPYGHYVVIEFADKFYNYVTGFLFLCFAKVCLSHRLQAGTERGLGTLQHSFWPDVRSNRLAIWTKGLWFLCESMNFHPDKQLFQVAGAGERNTDPWITKPPHHGDPLQIFLRMVFCHLSMRLILTLDLWPWEHQSTRFPHVQPM